jgi:hypothetical protein
VPQYRKGGPSAFGVLRYKGTPKDALPSDPVPQSKDIADRKWTPDVYIQKVGVGAGWGGAGAPWGGGGEGGSPRTWLTASGRPDVVCAVGPHRAPASCADARLSRRPAPPRAPLVPPTP